MEALFTLGGLAATLLTAAYTAYYARWALARGYGRGALGLGLLSALIAGLPVYLLFAR